MINIKEINTKEELTSFLDYNKDDLHVVKFGADWCGPCKLIEQRILNLNPERIGNTLFAEISIDDQDGEQAEMASDYGVANIPVLLFFKGGEMVNRSVGALPSEKIYEAIEKINGQNN